ncbi:hypothetical protein [Aeromicrobium sp. JJY06]|uniref:DUF6414 family protein n=1 Tax=Aeromicrobium sp. JJY06 TaxID=3373478 RepID=UPI00376F3DC2
MAKYIKPKKRLHREFLYLNYDTVINSLSALEAGMVDEIIEKSIESGEGGFEGGLSAGPAKVGASKKKQASMEAELRRTRTRFSAFDSWYSTLDQADAIGRFEGWDQSVRDELEVGDTIEFVADVKLSPIFRMFTAYTSFVEGATKPGNVFDLKGKELAEAKGIARMMENWMSGAGGQRTLPVYLAPHGAEEPRILGSLEAPYIVGGLENAEGRFTVIGQVDSLLGPDDKVSAVRILKDSPATPMEIDTMTEAVKHMQEGAEGLGVFIGDDDITFTSPAVMIRPIAVFR